MGFTNVVVMIPFCRSTEEADRVLAVMAENGSTRGENGLEVYVMCEIPSNVILAEAFAERFDGFSIGCNDLTQLTLGVDRDSAELAAAVRRAGRGGEVDDRERHRARRTRPAPRSGCAARRRATIRNSPSSWSRAASIPCR